MSRENFETWYLREWGHTEDNHESLFERCPDSPEEYYRLGVRLAHEAWQAATASLQAERDQLAAENAALKNIEAPLGSIENGRAFADRLEAYPFECQGGNLNMCSDWQDFRRCFEHLSEWAMHGQSETPATDRFLADQRALGRVEGINYAAGRLAAAYNHGFVDKPLTEVGDVVRMILDARDELTRALTPAADGLSGEYAEKALKKWEAQLSNNEVKV